MDVLLTHKQVVEDYASYIQSLLNIADPAIRSTVENRLAEGRLWPEPLLQFNPAYKSAGTVEALAAKGPGFEPVGPLPGNVTNREARQKLSSPSTSTSITAGAEKNLSDLVTAPLLVPF